MRSTVVIVGGGYGGIAAARALDDVANVVLVERKDAFVHNIATLRAAVDPSWLSRIFYPYDRLLQNGRVVQERVTHADAKQVTLASGEQISFDFLVLATGSTYPFPAKSDVDDTATAQDKYRAVQAALAVAGRVLLVGAGPVGLEMAGEITSAWPDKHVTIVDLAADILNGPFKPELRAELRSQLTARGVELILGGGLSRMPRVAPGILETFVATTEAGVDISADVWLRSYGVTPVTDYLADDLSTARTPSGQLTVTPHLRLPGHDNVFAIGDITAIPEPKMAARARRHGELVGANISALITGDSDLNAYEPGPPAILIPLGPDGGAGQLPGTDGIAGPDVVSQYKGQHLSTDRYAEIFGVLAAHV